MRDMIRDEVRAAPPYAFQDVPGDVKLDQNEAPHDLPEAVRRRLLDRLADADWNRYPALRAEEAHRALAGRDGWHPEGVLLAPGSNVLIQTVVIAAGLGRTVLTVEPTFSVYGQQARLLGAKHVRVPLKAPGFTLDVEGIERALKQGPGVWFLADPAAPTGNRHDDGAVERLLDVARAEGWLTVIDEAYWPYDRRHRLDQVRGQPDRIALRTFSKADAMGGVRLGYALGETETIAELTKVVLPFNVSTWQSTAVALLATDPEANAAREARIDEAIEERARVYAALQSMEHVDVHPSVTNFLLFSVPDAKWVYDQLLEAGIRIRRQDHLPGLDGHLRVSMGTPNENDRFLDALTRVLNLEVTHG